MQSTTSSTAGSAASSSAPANGAAVAAPPATSMYPASFVKRQLVKGSRYHKEALAKLGELDRVSQSLCA